MKSNLKLIDQFKQWMLSEHKLMEVETKDGTKIRVDSMEKGASAFVITVDEETQEEKQVELPDGDYEVVSEQGNVKIEVKDGKIEEIETVESEVSEETETEVEMTKDEVSAMIEEKMTALKEEIQAMLPEKKEEMSEEQKAELAKQEEAKKAELAKQEEAKKETGAPVENERPMSLNLSSAPSRGQAIMARIAQIKK